jgi:hypothetical protein
MTSCNSHGNAGLQWSTPTFATRVSNPLPTTAMPNSTSRSLVPLFVAALSRMLSTLPCSHAASHHCSLRHREHATDPYRTSQTAAPTLPNHAMTHSRRHPARPATPLPRIELGALRFAWPFSFNSNPLSSQTNNEKKREVTPSGSQNGQHTTHSPSMAVRRPCTQTTRLAWLVSCCWHHHNITAHGALVLQLFHTTPKRDAGPAMLTASTGSRCPASSCWTTHKLSRTTPRADTGPGLVVCPGLNVTLAHNRLRASKLPTKHKHPRPHFCPSACHLACPFLETAAGAGVRRRLRGIALIATLDGPATGPCGQRQHIAFGVVVAKIVVTFFERESPE